MIAQQFNHFKELVTEKSRGQPFVSFQEGLPAEWERYKEEVRYEALGRLAVASWTPADVGRGKILAHAIQAIEIDASRPKLRNNLVAWPNRYGHQSRSHHALLDAQKDAAIRRKIELWFYQFFGGKLLDGPAFESFVALAGAKYDLVAYFFFLKDWKRFMPIGTSAFDKAFKLLGVDLVTSRHCSWENYVRYNAVLSEVRSYLRDVEEIPGVRLLDAHSFCWMLSELKDRAKASASSISAPRLLTNVESLPPTADSNTAGIAEFAAIDEAEFAKWDAQKRRTGRIAQEVALQSERRRLFEQGHPNPDLVPLPVWDEPGRGYDILSAEMDGSPRHIEVKAARRTKTKISFFVSCNEWQKSQNMKNYWFYLVFEPESTAPDVVAIPADVVSPTCLAPVNYLAAIRAASSIG